MILKQVIRYSNANVLEATWVNASGVPVKCQAYANNQMDLLAAHLGADAPQYQSLMNEVAATYVPPTLDLPAARAARWDEIKALRDRKTQQGGYKVGSNWFHSDTFSRTQQIGLTIMGTSMPVGLQWKTMGGAFVGMTPTLAQQVFAAAGAQDAALFTHAEVLKAQVDASADPATVDITAGWPETFGGV